MRYRIRPTRFAPPLPRESLAVIVSFFSANRFFRSTIPVEPAPIKAQPKLTIDFGQYGFSQQPDRSLHLGGPGVDLTFRPMFSQKPVEISLDPKHRWVLTDGLCQVNGSVEIDGAKLAIDGAGFHDQQYGTEPMLRNAFSGHILFKDRAFAFRQSNVMHTSAFESDSLRVTANRLEASPLARTLWGLWYPNEIHFENGMRLTDARIIASRPTRADVVYNVNWNNQEGTAHCEIHAPSRLRVSILGDY